MRGVRRHRRSEALPSGGGTSFDAGGEKEADVDERSRVLAATCLGAVLGGVWGWLYLTEHGRRVRDQIEPTIDNLVTEMTRVRGTVDKARAAANEGWRSLSDITSGQGGGRWSA